MVNIIVCSHGNKNCGWTECLSRAGMIQRGGSDTARTRLLISVVFIYLFYYY